MINKRSSLKYFLTFIFGGLLFSTITCVFCYQIYSKKLIALNNNQLGNYMKGAFNWLENSGEAESLEYQAFNSATASLSNMVKEPSSKPKAIILDIDETCLNNAPFQGYELLNDNAGFDFSTWDKWVNYAKATAIPGSVDFTKAAAKDGVQIFYISGRSQNEMAATVKNLDNLGFAQANEPGHVILLPPNQSGKQPTFDQLEQNYDVVMFVGDQLSDMGSIMHGNSADNKEQVTQYKDNWGSKFIAIPDPLYGNYIGALDNDKQVTPSEQIQILNSHIQTFDPKTGKVFYNK